MLKCVENCGPRRPPKRVPWARCQKKDVNRDSHIASTPISQNYFFKEVRYLILASSQRKLRRYIKFLKFDFTVQKKWKIQIFLKFKSLHQFSQDLVLVHLRTKFQLDKSKFAWVRQFWKNSQKIQNLKKFKRFNRFWPNSIPKFLDECYIFVCSFRTIARILRKLELPRPFFQKIQNPIKSQIGHQLSWKQP